MRFREHNSASTQQQNESIWTMSQTHKNVYVEEKLFKSSINQLFQKKLLFTANIIVIVFSMQIYFG